MILIWRFGKFGFNRQIFMSANTDYSQTIPFMSVFINPMFAKLNAHQFPLHSNLPNLMFAKCTAYMVHNSYMENESWLIAFLN